MPFTIEKPSVIIIKGFKIQKNIVSTQAKAQSLFLKQRALERKIKAGKKLKAIRGDFVLVNGKKTWIFFDEKLKKTVRFSSRKKWFNAIKQQEKIKSKGLIPTLEEIKKGIKISKKIQKKKLKQFFKNEKKAGEVLHDKILKPKRTKTGMKIVDDKGKTIMSVERKPTTTKPTVRTEQVRSGNHVLLQKTKQKVVTVQKQAVKQKQILVQKVKQTKRLGVRTNIIPIQKQIQKLAVLIILLNKQAQAVKQLQEQVATQKLGQSVKQAQKVSQAVKQAQKQAQKAAQKVSQGVKQAQAVAQKIKPLSKLKAKTLQKITKTKKKLIILPKRDKKVELDRVINRKIKQRQFIYIPDLYSLVYDVRASAKEKAFFMKKGRVFSGVSIRKIIV